MLVLGTLTMLLVSCGTSAPRYNYKELARASVCYPVVLQQK